MRQLRKSAARENREREETQRRQQMCDLERAIRELETGRVIEEERSTEAVRRKEEADEREFIHQGRLRECAVCTEENDMDYMIQAPCMHWYCREDLQSKFSRRYRLMVLESTTPNPVYCSNRASGVFVPPAQYQGPNTAACRACGSMTCRMCRNAAHDGVCPQDVGLQQAVSLAARKGWRTCPSCNSMVEKRLGCNHITCRCGGQFCYVCGGVWGACREHE
ncbi:hypothetical protein GGR55DRAFT_687061 [Xylaria sp. FL0064]|nr:hypothetical protein GGR55DRAFT_687061 [Xylaria sp. FL0064]